MTPRRSLRRRLFATLLGFGAGIVIVMGVVTHMLAERQERLVWHALLELEMQVYADQLARGLERRPDAGRLLKAYAWPAGGPAPDSAPESVRQLPYGLGDDLILGDREYTTMVKDVDGRRLTLLLDITSFEAEETRLATLTLIAMLATLALLALASVVLATALVRPVRDLVRRVAELDPRRRGARIDGAYSDTELATLAEAVDGYLERLDAFVQREHEFISAVSHELRTPMAVIGGAAEVLRDATARDERAAAPLARIEQGVRDLDETLATLLYLATEPGAPSAAAEPCRVDELVPAIVRDHAHLLAGKQQRVELGVLEPTAVNAPARIVYIAIGNLVRNAIQHSFVGAVGIALEGGVLRVTDHGPGMSAAEISRVYAAGVRRAAGGREGGLGLYIIQRICARFGWRLELASEPGRGTTATLDLRASVADR